MGEAPEHIVLVETEADVDALEVADPDKLAYISQTTLSVDETRAIINRLRERFPNITGPRTDDICYATTNRQAAVKQMAPQCDLVLVIGSRNSSNSQPPRRGRARARRRRRYLIDNEAQVAARSGSRASASSASPPARARPRSSSQRLVDFFRERGDDGRRGVRGRPGGRALHAAEDDPPGARGARRVAGRRRMCGGGSSAPAARAAPVRRRRGWRPAHPIEYFQAADAAPGSVLRRPVAVGLSGRTARCASPPRVANAVLRPR